MTARATALPAARELCVLGPTSCREHGVGRALRQRELDVLAALALHHPRAVPVLSVVELLWATDPPRTAKEAVQNHVARLRRALGDGAIITDAGSYRLGAEWSLDAQQFDTHVMRARRAALDNDHLVTRIHLRKALALVRGDAYSDLPESGAVVAAVSYTHLTLPTNREV